MIFNGIKDGIRSRIDPLGWGGASAAVARRALMNPLGVVKANTELAANAARIPFAAASMYAPAQMSLPMEIDMRDRRFSNRAWSENPAYVGLRQYYLALHKYVDGLLSAGEGDPIQDGKARQVATLMLDAMAPTSFLGLNPDALAAAYETGGRSVLKGARFAAEDIVKRGGRPVKVDRDAFTIGEDIAATPGKVVYRNELIEVIQYEPQTKKVHAKPLLVTPPWINKYYILDLGTGRSLVEMAVKLGRTVFAISYINPGRDLADVGMDDYYRLGTSTALDVVQEITGAPTVDILSICLGGAMSAMTTAREAAEGRDRIGTITMLNSMLDYSEPGELSLMTDGATLDMIEKRMNRKGYLSGDDMSGAFDMIRAKDLIFNYWVSRWMKGDDPVAFDILAWNEDSTRMPATMHSEYLRGLYQDNALCKGEFVLDGVELDLSKITNDAYLVGAVGDHIVPWSSSYKAVGLLGGDVRYVQSNGGHLAGALNPPSKKTWYRAIGKPEDDNRKAYPATAAEFEEAAPKVTGDSWWSDWAVWMSSRAGEQIDPPPMGSKKHKVLCAAPGEYVFVQ